MHRTLPPCSVCTWPGILGQDSVSQAFPMLFTHVYVRYTRNAYETPIALNAAVQLESSELMGRDQRKHDQVRTHLPPCEVLVGTDTSYAHDLWPDRDVGSLYNTTLFCTIQTMCICCLTGGVVYLYGLLRRTAGKRRVASEGEGGSIHNPSWR